MNASARLIYCAPKFCHITPILKSFSYSLRSRKHFVLKQAKHSSLLLCTCFAEPDGAPQNVRGRNTSSTIISVSWEAVQAERRNGIITGYNITYQSLTENDNGFVTTGPDDRQANLTELKEFVEYHISVVAFTVKGDGPPSVLVVRTDQDSK